MAFQWQLLWDKVMEPIAESIRWLQVALQEVHSTVLQQLDMVEKITSFWQKLIDENRLLIKK